MQPVLHQDHVSPFNYEDLDGREEGEVPVLLALAADDCSQAQWGGEDDMGVVEVGEVF